MKLAILLLCAVGVWAQTEPLPLAEFKGTVRHIDNSTITLSRADEEDMDVLCTHKTHYYSGTQKIKREAIKVGDRVLIETKLDPLRKPEAVNVRVLPEEKP